MTQKIEEYEYRDLGVDHAQYFTGAGVAFSKWTAVYVGCGDTLEEALNDAAEMAAQSCEWADVPSADDSWSEFEGLTESAHVDCDEEDDDHETCELYHYAALYIR